MKKRNNLKTFEMVPLLLYGECIAFFKFYKKLNLILNKIEDAVSEKPSTVHDEKNV